MAPHAVRAVMLGVFLALPGCFEFQRPLTPVYACTSTERGRLVTDDSVDTLDLLFVIDDSRSMAHEQALLRREIPRMIAVLASGNSDDDPEREFTAVRSMHVGVVSTNMGGDARVSVGPIAACAGLGGDGVMNDASRPGDTEGLPPCEGATYPRRIFEFETGDDAAAFGDQMSCVANLGTGGCNFEQQLEAALKALSPRDPDRVVALGYVPPTFAGGTRGHGDGANAGFLRPGSLLAIVLLTDEDDCSAADTRLFDANVSEYGPGTARDLGLRCTAHPDALHPVGRYIEGFLQLRDNPSLLVFAAITGVPIDASDSYDELLGDSRMQYFDDPERPDATPLRPSCEAVDPANGVAYPPRRIVEVAQGLETARASTTVQSICADTFGPAVDTIVGRIADAITDRCLPRPLIQAADGTVNCEVLELLPGTGEGAITCEMADLELVDVELTPVRRELCRIPQITPSEGAAGSARGWYYDNSSAELHRICPAYASQRVAFSLLMPTGTDLRLNCVETLVPSSGEVQLGSFCTPFAPTGDANPCAMGVAPSMSEQAFTCDPLLRTCGLACTSDVDCDRAGLLSYVCDRRLVLDVVGGQMSRVPDVDGSGGPGDAADAAEVYGYCTNPAC